MTMSGTLVGPGRRPSVVALVTLLLAGLALFATPAPAHAAACGTANVALNQPAAASSSENASFPASAAFDGNQGTRWSSQFSDPQWIQVDLGSTRSICGIQLRW